MDKTAWALLCLGAFVVAALLGWSQWGPRDRSAASIAPEHSRVPDTTTLLDSASDSEDAAKLRGEGQGEQSGRQEVDAEGPRSPLGTGYQGRVVGSNGESLVGAQVVRTWPDEDWTAMPALERAHGWPELVSETTTTDEEGRFGLDVHRNPGVASIIWVTAPDFLAEFRFLGSNLEPDLNFRLSPALGLDVIVVDGQGRGVPDAEVVSVSSENQASPDALRLDPIVRSALVRTARTSEDGTCVIPAFPGEQVLLARTSDQVTVPWTGLAPRSVRMTLSPCFYAGGRVLRGSLELDPGELEVTASAVIAGQKRSLDRARVRPDGGWGPLTMTAVGAESLVFRLEGGGVIPVEERRALAQPGGHLVIDFAPSLGIPVHLLVQDVDEEPIAGAWVMAWWLEGMEWNRGEAWTGASGLARIDAIRAGEVWFKVKAQGHLEFNYGPVLISEPPKTPFLIDLLPAGRIEGRVLVNGEPVPSFNITYFSSLAKEPSRIGVSDEPKGEFQIAEAPLGETILLASAPGYAPSEPQAVEVTTGETKQVDLHLRAPRMGRGRVVDALSGLPIADARIETWVEFDRRWVVGTRLEARSDVAGEFLLAGLRPEGDCFEARAEGYSERRFNVGPGGEDVVDLGVIALSPAQDVRVVLRAEGIDPTECQVHLVSQQDHPWRSFTPSGLAEFENVLGGHALVEVQLPSGIEVKEDTYLTPGQEWILHVDVRERDSAGLEVVLKGEFEARQDLQIRAVMSLGLDRIRTRIVPVRDGRCQVPGPLGSEVTLELQTTVRELLSVRHVRADELQAGRIEFFARAFRRSIRTVDPLGNPVPRVTATITVQDDRSQWRSLQLQTDESGRVSFLVPPEEHLLLHLRPPEGGGMTDIELDPRLPEEEEFEVVLDVTSGWDVEVHDGNYPQQGVVVSLLTASGFRFASLDATDAQGRASYDALRPGPYLAEVSPPGYWSRYVPIEVNSPRSQERIDIRRLGALSLVVRTAADQALPNASVHLESVEFGTLVEQWITEGLVRAPENGLRTDADGRLKVLALPHGPYRYRISSPDGREAQGQLVVPPHAEGQVKVVLP